METLVVTVTVVLIAVLLTRLSVKSRKIKRLEEEKEILIENMEPEAKAMLMQISTDIHGMRSEMGEMKISINNIDRAMYGDKPNKTPGMIDRQKADEERISALEKNMVSKKTVAGWVAGLSSLVAGIGHAVKEFIK